MTWNNGNGNGGGYGNDDVYNRLNNTRDVGGARFPFIEGSGKYALCTLEEFPHSTDGPSARALLKVLESKDGKHAVGSFVVKIWKLAKPPKFQGQASDADMFADFCRKLKGAPAGYPIGNDIRVLMKERPRDQLARGTVIEAVGVPNQKKTWINIYWNNVQQSPADIAALRQRLEAEGIPDTGAGPTQGAPQPQRAYEPGFTASNGMPAYAAPPVTSGHMHQQPQGQYPASVPYAPGGWQGTAQVGPQPMPQQGPAQAPPEGFLAGVPTNGGNGQGGRGGPVGW